MQRQGKLLSNAVRELFPGHTNQTETFLILVFFPANAVAFHVDIGTALCDIQELRKINRNELEHI